MANDHARHETSDGEKIMHRKRLYLISISAGLVVWAGAAAAAPAICSNGYPRWANRALRINGAGLHCQRPPAQAPQAAVKPVQPPTPALRRQTTSTPDEPARQNHGASASVRRQVQPAPPVVAGEQPAGQMQPASTAARCVRYDAGTGFLVERSCG